MNPKHVQFERLIIPHLDAAYNLARWLMRNDADAEEAVQEAYLRAYQFFASFHGEDGRAWLLTIVRNSCYTLGGKKLGNGMSEEFDEQIHVAEEDVSGLSTCHCRNPESIALVRADQELVNRAIENLPVVFREVLVMRELEDMSYKEIAKIIDVPLGTVMSRLARGRMLLQRALAASMNKELPL